MQQSYTNEIKNYAFITAGSVVLAIGIVIFLIPGKIATGGTPGMAIILHYITDLPTGMLMIAVNIPLLIAGFRMLGKGFALRTIVTIIQSSILIDIFTEVIKLPHITESTMLATLYGGICVGAGVGLILKGNASAGGSTIVAKLIANHTEIKPGQTIMLIDLTIIAASGFIFNDIEKALWSLISIYVTSKIIDMILTGAPSEKVVHIATNKPLEMSALIQEHIGRAGSIIKCSGLNKSEEKNIIFIVVEPRKINRLRELIKDCDPEAFMVVMEARELLGRGHGG